MLRLASYYKKRETKKKIMAKEKEEGLFATAIESAINKTLAPIRIKSIIIQNYKSINYKEYILEGKSLFLKGKNGLGKTNVFRLGFLLISPQII